MKKHIILVIAGALLFTGCVSRKVEQPDGTKYSYTKLGKQRLEGFAYSRDRDKVDLLLDKSDGSEAQALTNMTETMLNYE